MSQRKKILAYTIKLSVGVLCFGIIYFRMRSAFGNNASVFGFLNDPVSLWLLAACCLFMPVNWGIEAYKWRLITKGVEPIGFWRAYGSVMAGVCTGNLAPGRSTEFVAKILFFKPENRALISVLHFVNGMLQLSVTIVIGVLAFMVRIGDTGQAGPMIYGILLFSGLLLLLFLLVIFRFRALQSWLFSLKWLRPYKPEEPVELPLRRLLMLFVCSVWRYTVFVIQFFLLFACLQVETPMSSFLCSVGIYFMLTSIVPMISIIEPAIRAAIALFVFNMSDEESVKLVTISTLLWLINIVLPSLIGYIIILKEKFVIKTKFT
ncbi:MAG: flippase-like domain-containing protein [Bacteroidetes bacterium]|nr:flippase-like domain-containing protein [Bacteroidota bacterium]